MDLKRSLRWSSALIFLCASVFGLAQAPKKIAVYPFDDHANTNKDINIGLKVADALVAKLTQGGAVTIVDRQYLAQIESEKNLKYDPKFDPAGSARTGLLGVVDALVVGQIDAFGTNVLDTQTGNLLKKHDKKTGEANLRVTARLISIERGSILAAPTANSEPTTLLSESSSVILVQGANDSSTAKNADKELLKLVDKAVDDVAGQLAKTMASSIAAIPAAVVVRTIHAKYVGMDAGSILINKGSSAGVQIGDKFALSRVSITTMIDPDTKKPITRHKRVCDLTISSVEEALASGKCVGDAPQSGDEATLAP